MGDTAVMVVFVLGFVVLFAGDSIVAIIQAVFEGLAKVARAWRKGE